MDERGWDALVPTSFISKRKRVCLVEKMIGGDYEFFRTPAKRDD